MSPRLELDKELREIIENLLKYIIMPISGKNYMGCNYWLSTIDSCILGTDNEFYDEIINEVLDKIYRRYNIREEEFCYVDENTPFMQIALFLYLRERNGVPDGS